MNALDSRALGLRIQPGPLLEQLNTLADIGMTPEGACCRLALSDEDRIGRDLLITWMKALKLEVSIDPIGNIFGWRAGLEDLPPVMTGSHIDTVRTGGRYDGPLGVLGGLEVVRTLNEAGIVTRRPLVVAAFTNEEGARFHPDMLGSLVYVGGLSLNDAYASHSSDGKVLIDELTKIGYVGKAALPLCKPHAFVELHIEQGPVLNELDMPLGIVTSINGSIRMQCEIIGTASHAGTTPMDRRADAATALAELALYVEQRALTDGDSVATIGMLQVPNGSVNVVPGRCLFSLDMRAPVNAQRDALAADILAALQGICERRGLRYTAEESMRAAAAPSAPAWQARWETAVSSLGLPLHRMPSGAGHDAMKLHEIMPQAMLFVRGQNSGISHNPLESSTNDDMQLAFEAFMHLLTHHDPSGN